MSPMMCMAIAMFFEARDQGIEGMKAIGHVIETRVASSKYPNTICGVVTDDRGPNKLHDCQFSFYCDGKSDDPLKYNSQDDQKRWDEAKLIAEAFIHDEIEIEMVATHYHADWMKKYPSWSKHFDKVDHIGDHIFYME